MIGDDFSMTEIEKIKYAKSFIDKMANGINPINDLPALDDDMINNVRISRCLFYVSELMQQIVEHGGIFKKNELKKDFYITDEALIQFPYSKEPISVSEIAKRISSLIDLDVYKALSYKPITDWLVDIKLLEIAENASGKPTKRPTKAGADMGIFTEERMGHDGPYTAVLYNQDAQRFIINNISNLINN